MPAAASRQVRGPRCRDQIGAASGAGAHRMLAAFDRHLTCAHRQWLPVRKSASMSVSTAPCTAGLMRLWSRFRLWKRRLSACGSDDMAGLVITGGRVVDPASGMDAVGDVAVLDGQIAAVGTGLGGAERTIDATGLVVAPGFIDLHAHGQSIPADRMQAFDGVTTTLDLEAGVLAGASREWVQASRGPGLNYGSAGNLALARSRTCPSPLQGRLVYAFG